MNRPAIYSAMESNGSTKPTFETDDASYVLVTLVANKSNQVNDGAFDRVNKLNFKGIDNIVAVIDGASDGVSNQVSNQVRAIVNEKVSPATARLNRIVLIGIA